MVALKRNPWIFVVLLVVVLAAAVWVFWPDSATQTLLAAPPSDFGSLLEWLLANGGAGIAVVVGFVMSWLLEAWPWFAGLSGQIKQAFVAGFSIALGLGALWLKAHPATVDAMQPWADWLVMAIGIWLATQAAHKLVTRPKG